MPIQMVQILARARGGPIEIVGGIVSASGVLFLFIFNLFLMVTNIYIIYYKFIV